MKAAAVQKNAVETSSPASVGGLLQRTCACGAHTSSLTGECKECAAKKKGIQKKLAIGASSDPLEREADQVADSVLGGRADARTGAAPIRIQRSASPASVGDAYAPSSVDRVLASSGAPLAPTVRHDMERSFGHDFSRVRVHTDESALQSALDVRAHAYTAGSHIVFGATRFAPTTSTGRRLLAHELTHVVQQGRAARPEFVQRDLATPPPATPAAAQLDLTAAQIASAIRFNRARYDAASTRLIQNIVGSKPTGKWVEDDIVAIGIAQEEYNFKKDGMVGEAFFRFLDKEVRLEKLPTRDANCLLAFRVITRPQTVGPVVAGARRITGNFQVRAQFSNTCGCADYQYRQFIRGQWRRERAGVVTDLGPTFTTLPGGAGLPAAFIEDGNTSSVALNYGHREQPAESINHYLDRAGNEAQADGCVYESEDTPGGSDNVQAGDIFDIDVNFRGEIQRNGRVVRTQNWSAINGRFPVP